MKLIVISHPTSVTDEARIVNELFKEGLVLFHLRKPTWNLKETIDFILQIHEECRPRLVMHDHHALAGKVGTKRIHFSAAKRSYTPEHELRQWRAQHYVLSTSIHHPDEYATLPDHFHYTFFGPVFESISKTGYRPDQNKTWKFIDRKIELIAIGGISPTTLAMDEVSKFDGAALHGVLWDDPQNAVKIFKDAKRA